jgi:hypothetical protein
VGKGWGHWSRWSSLPPRKVFGPVLNFSCRWQSVFQKHLWPRWWQQTGKT